MRFTIFIIVLSFALSLHSQDTEQEDQGQQLPYYEIPEAPDSYSATNVLARLVDGLGFRYYWATEGLRSEDLSFKASESGRTSEETLYHLYGLVDVINNSVNKRPNVRPLPEITMTYEELRTKTLSMLKEASDILRAADPSEIDDYKVIFQRGDNQSEFPFWNQINGPISDALWHTGQIVLLRRASGNPFNSRASVFSGKLRGN